MKLLITFLLSFFLLSPGGNNVVFGSTHATRNHKLAVQDILISRALQRTVEKQHCLLPDPRAMTSETELELFTENSRDDENTRKCRLLIASFSTFIYPFLATQVVREPEYPLAFLNLPSPISDSKYIAQRVLRL